MRYVCARVSCVRVCACVQVYMSRATKQHSNIHTHTCGVNDMVHPCRCTCRLQGIAGFVLSSFVPLTDCPNRTRAQTSRSTMKLVCVCVCVCVCVKLLRALARGPSLSFSVFLSLSDSLSRARPLTFSLAFSLTRVRSLPFSSCLFFCMWLRCLPRSAGISIVVRNSAGVQGAGLQRQ